MAAIVPLSVAELLDLRRRCSNPFMDLGSTLRPAHLECLEARVARRRASVLFKFPSHEAARKWNDMHEARIRAGGHIATVALAGVVSVIARGPRAATVTGATAAIVKDEVQAMIWYPKMHKDWTLVREFNFRYSQYPSQYLVMNWTDVITDEDGIEQERRAHGSSRFDVGEPFGIPEILVRKMMTELPSSSVRTFE